MKFDHLVLSKKNDVKVIDDSHESEGSESVAKSTKWTSLSSLSEKESKSVYFIRGKTYEFTRNSLFLFGPTSSVRHYAVIIITSRTFEYFNVGIILANSFILGIADYSHIDRNPHSTTYTQPISSGSWRNATSNYGNVVCTIFFCLEMLLKMIAMGFIFGNRTYLKDGWNVFDFSVVITSLLGLLPAFPSFSSLLRVFRILRVLKNMSALQGLRRMIQSVLSALPELGNVFLLLFFLFMLFSVMGMCLFCGSVNAVCRLTPFPVKTNWTLGMNFTEYRCLNAPNVDLPTPQFPTQSSSPWHEPQDCYWPTDDSNQRPCAFPGSPGNHHCYQTWCGSNWDAYGNARFKGETTVGVYGDYYFSKDHLMAWGEFNPSLDYGYTTFDNIFRAFITVFECVTLENWSWIMFMHRDTNTPILPAFFFIAFTMLGAHVGLNLILAVLDENVASVQDSLSVLPSESKDSLNCDQFLVLLTPTTSRVIRQTSFLYNLVMNRWFNNLVTCVIVINTVILAADHYPSSPSFDDNSSKGNFFCTIFFALDMSVKMAALGIRDYCHDSFNIFDGFVVSVSIVELCMSPPLFISGRQSHSKGISAFRILRLLRLFKLINQWKGMRVLFRKIAKSLPQLVDLLLFVVLFVYVFGLVGQAVFANRICFDSFGFAIPPSDPRNNGECWVSRANYDTVAWSMFNTFNIMTAENWNNIMYDGWRGLETGFSFLYFMVVVALGQFVVMALFLAVLLSNFERDDDETQLPIVKAQESRDSEDTIFHLENAIRAGAPNISKPVDVSNSIFPLCHGKSLMLFGSSHPIRYSCACVISHANFDMFVLILIIISTVCLVIDDPLMDPNSTFSRNLSVADEVFTLLFCVEMSMKIIATGFFFQDRAYLRSGWNILDFVVVLVSLISCFSVHVSDKFKSLRSLRVLRAFRPLRMIQRVPSLKKVVSTLFIAFSGVLDSMAFLLFFLLVFGCVGVSLFKGQMRNCSLGAQYTPGALYDSVSNNPNAFGTLLSYPKSWNSLNLTEKGWFGPESPFNLSLQTGNCSVLWPQAPCCDAWPKNPNQVPTSKDICLCWGSSWDLWWGYWKFDWIGDALLSFYSTSSTEGWVYLMLECVDQNGIDMQPIRDNSMPLIFFFVVFIIVIHFFSTNLFVGVILENFEKSSQGEEFLFLTEQQKLFVKTQRVVAHMNPYKVPSPPGNRIGDFCFACVIHPKFDMVIMGCIMLNALTMTFQHKTQDDAFTLFLSSLDDCFCFIFTTEATLKLFALRMGYFKDDWNKFDFFIVALTDTSLVVKLVTGSSVGPLPQLLRTFRVARMLRLINGAESLNTFLRTLFSAFIGLINIFSLFLLIIFIFSLLAHQLFATVAWPNLFNTQMGPYYNFVSFTSSLVTLFSFSGGEYWDGFAMELGSKTPGCVADPPYNPDMCGFETSLTQNTLDPQSACIPLNGCGNQFGVWFMCTFYFVVVIVFLNLFVGVIIDEFSNQHPKHSLITRKDLQSFGSCWAKFDPNATSFIDYCDVPAFLTTVASPWALLEALNKKYMRNKAAAWKLKIYKGNKVHYYDLLHALTKDIMEQRLKGLDSHDQGSIFVADALKDIMKTHHLDEKEPELLNGVQVEPLHHFAAQLIQQKQKQHRASLKKSRTGECKVYPTLRPQKMPSVPKFNFSPRTGRTKSSSGLEILSMLGSSQKLHIQSIKNLAPRIEDSETTLKHTRGQANISLEQFRDLETPDRSQSVISEIPLRSGDCSADQDAFENIQLTDSACCKKIKIYPLTNISKKTVASKIKFDDMNAT